MYAVCIVYVIVILSPPLLLIIDNYLLIIDRNTFKPERFLSFILKNTNLHSRNRNNNSGTTFECAIVKRDDQRQSSQRNVSKNTLQKLQNRYYVTGVLRRYNSLKPFIADGSTDVSRMNYMTRHGIPMAKQNHKIYSSEYIVRCYTQVMKFISSHKMDRPTTTTRKVADKLSAIVYKESRYNNPTKAERYGLHIPKTITVEPTMYNGERTNIPLSEIFC